MGFVSLHVHDYYSLLDSVAKPEALVARAKELGMTALGITNHGHLFSHVKFYHACRAQGIKPIIGVEAYLVADHTQKTKGYSHLTLLAVTQQGYKNLLQLVSTSYMQGFYYKPRIDLSLLRKYHEGIMCLTGCYQGELNQHLAAKNFSGASTWLQELREVFGKHLRWEYTPAHYPGAKEIILQGAELSKNLKIEPIVTSDVHYVKAEDAKLRNMVWQIRDGKTLAAPGQLDETKEYYLMSEEEIRAASLAMGLKSDLIERAIHNTHQIGKDANVKIEQDKYVVANFCPTPQEQFRRECSDGMKRLRIESTTYQERLQLEMQVIERMNLVNYFLVVQDVIRFCVREHILVGPGRGSAAGSLVCYVLGITQVDPIKYDLLFERFLNPGRTDSYPDIDTDIAHEHRDRVVSYIKQKYGTDHVAQMITFGSMGPRTAIKDVGRVLGKDFTMLNRLTQMIPTKIGGAPIQSLEQVLEFHPEIAAMAAEEKELFETALELQKTPRHVSLHASALLITPEPLQHLAPLYQDPKTSDLVCGLDMYDCEKLKLLKFDFLGLKTLSVIQQALQLIHERHQKVIEMNAIDLQDGRVWDCFCRAETVGTFQTETDSMRQLLKKIQPRNLQELSVVNALDRPGPLNKKMDDLYVTHKKQMDALPVIDESIKTILAPTYQTLIYQEQVMQIAEVFAGFSKSDADVLRKSMGKKKRELVLKMKEQFLEGAAKLGRLPEVTEHLFTLIEEFSEYAFNMSHSLAYSLVSYQTAWLKVHYPLEFMCATLNVFSGQQEESEKYLRECRRMKIIVLPPDVQKSFSQFTIEGTSIRYGLCAIRDIGTDVAQLMIRLRPFSHVGLWLMKVRPNKKAIRALVKSGALDSLCPYRQSLLQYCEAHPLKALKQETTLFSMESLFTDMNKQLFDQDIGTDKQHPIVELLEEKQYLGCYARQHPLDLVPAQAQQLPHMTLGIMKEKWTALQNEMVTIHGLVESFKTVITKKTKEQMAYCLVSDPTGSIEMVIFPRYYEQAKTLIQKGQLVRIGGKVRAENFIYENGVLLYAYPNPHLTTAENSDII